MELWNILITVLLKVEQLHLTKCTVFWPTLYILMVPSSENGDTVCFSFIQIDLMFLTSV